MEGKKDQAGNSTSPDSYRDDTTPKVTGIGGIDTVGNKIELWEPS